MKYIRTTTITFEKLERCFYRIPDSEPLTAQCSACESMVGWLTPIQVVAVTGISLRELFRRIEAETLHFKESSAGLIHVCERSLGLQ